LGKEYRISSEGEIDDSELERQILEGGDGTIDPTIGTTFSEFGKLNQMKPEQQRVTGLSVGEPPALRDACAQLTRPRLRGGSCFQGRRRRLLLMKAKQQFEKQQRLEEAKKQIEKQQRLQEAKKRQAAKASGK
jgi:hypothetical protein